MSAGTVVIAGGILAAVILLTIVAVLCLCRLQVRVSSCSLNSPNIHCYTFLGETCLTHSAASHLVT